MTAPTQPPVPVRFTLSFPSPPPARNHPISTIVSVSMADIVYDNNAAPPMAVSIKARVVLQRPLSNDAGLHDWYQLANQMDVGARRDATLTGYGADGKVVLTYYLKGALPIRLEVSGVPGGTTMETFVVECQNFGRSSLGMLPTN